MQPFLSTFAKAVPAPHECQMYILPGGAPCIIAKIGDGWDAYVPVTSGNSIAGTLTALTGYAKDEMPARYKAKGSLGWGYGDTVASALCTLYRHNPKQPTGEVEVCERVDKFDDHGARYAYEAVVEDDLKQAALDVAREKAGELVALLRAAGKADLAKRADALHAAI